MKTSLITGKRDGRLIMQLQSLSQQRMWTPREGRGAREGANTDRNATVYFDYFLNSHVAVKANLQHHLLWCLMFTEKNSK